MNASSDEHWMRLALAQARLNGSDPSNALFGCVIVRDGELLAAERNRTRDLPDATAHAEMMAIRRAGEVTGGAELRGATLYTTLQPCGMCAMASVWARVGRIVYGAGREDVHPMYFETRRIDTMALVRDADGRGPGIEGGCLREACAALYFRPDDKPPGREGHDG